MFSRRELLVSGAAMGLSGLVACSSPPPPPPPGIVDLSIAAAPDINPDADGRPSPAMVRVYQLASGGKFETADFFQLFDKEKATLGQDLVARQELSISPGRSEHLVIPLKQDARVVAVAVSFRDIDQAAWRATIGVPPVGTTPLDATIQGLRVTLVRKGS